MVLKSLMPLSPVKVTSGKLEMSSYNMGSTKLSVRFELFPSDFVAFFFLVILPHNLWLFPLPI